MSAQNTVSIQSTNNVNNSGSSVQAIRCWACGQDANAYDTNPMNPESPNFGPGSNSWCTSEGVSSVGCVPDKSGQELFCYKEIWTVDGDTSK